MTGLSYSADAESNTYYFFKDSNEINIFVEDAKKEYEYETILKKILGNNYKISKIFGLGGKNNVIKNYEEFGEYNKEQPSIKNIYILDGDFDRYLSKVCMIKHSNVIYLPAYCIENYFLNEAAVISFMKWKLELIDSEIKSKILYSNWESEIIKDLSQMAMLHFISKEHGIKLDVKNKPSNYIKTDGKVNTDCIEAIKKDIQENDIDIEAEVSSLRIKYIENDNFFNLINGKYILYSLARYLQIRGEIKVNEKHLRNHLIENINVSKLGFIKETIDFLMGRHVLADEVKSSKIT